MTMNALKPFDLEIPPPEIYLKAITMNVFKDLNVICNSNKKKETISMHIRKLFKSKVLEQSY